MAGRDDARSHGARQRGRARLSSGGVELGAPGGKFGAIVEIPGVKPRAIPSDVAAPAATKEAGVAPKKASYGLARVANLTNNQ